MRAISALSFDAGTSTFGCRAAMALRTRVSISAIGSLVTYPVPPFLPARLDHAGHFTIQRQLPEAQPANSELAQERARTAAAPATVPVAALELRLLFLFVCKLVRIRSLAVFGDLGGCCHSEILFLLLLLPERHSHLLEQRHAFGVRPGSGGYGYVHSPGLIDLRIIDLGEDQLVFNAQRVVAAPVERFRRNAAEIAHTRQRDIE